MDTTKLNDSYQSVYNELLTYKDLESDWDGYGAEVPNPNVVNSCIEYLFVLQSENIASPKPMLSGTGEVGLYWNNSYSHFELGFDEPNLFTYYVRYDGEIVGADDIEHTEKPKELFDKLKLYTAELMI